MKYCTECGKTINITDKFCSHCGSPVAKNDISNQSNLDKPTKVKVDKTPIKSNKDSKVHIDEDGIPSKSKVTSKTFELDWINEDGSTKNHKVRQSKNNEFDEQPFIWIILLVAFILLVASQKHWNFGYSLGVVTGAVIKDGLFLAVPLGIVMVVLKKKYHWYHFLNMLAYATIFARLVFGSLL